MTDGPRVTVRYWAAARAAAGTTRDEHHAADVEALRGSLVEAHPDLAPVLAVASLLVDGRSARPGQLLQDGAVVEVLPPFAGG